MRIDFQIEAAQMRKLADRYQRRSVADARFAARQYEAARSFERHARFLTSYPPLWSPGSTPAAVEAMADATRRVADAYLKGVFLSAEHSRACRRRAREWDNLAAARKYREDLGL